MSNTRFDINLFFTDV